MRTCGISSIFRNSPISCNVASIRVNPFDLQCAPRSGGPGRRQSQNMDKRLQGLKKSAGDNSVSLEEMCLYSIAFQLKRIADALEDPPADPHLQKIAELLENLGIKS